MTRGSRTWIWTSATAVVAVLVLGWGAGRVLGGAEADGPAATVTGTGPQVTAAPATGPVVRGATGIGATARERSLGFTVDQLRIAAQGVPGGAATLRPTGQYVLVWLSVRNDGASAGRLRDDLQVMYDGLGTAYLPDRVATSAAGHGTGVVLPAAGTVDRVLVYDLPKAATPTRIEFHGRRGSTGVAVAL